MIEKLDIPVRMKKGFFLSKISSWYGWNYRWIWTTNIFDIDAYGNDINEFKIQINILFPDKIVNWATREPRKTDKGMEYSYRFYVQDVRITSKNLKQLLIDNVLMKSYI